MMATLSLPCSDVDDGEGGAPGEGLAVGVIGAEDVVGDVVEEMGMSGFVRLGEDCASELVLPEVDGSFLGEKNTVMVAGLDWSGIRLTVIGTAGLWYLSRGRHSRQNLLLSG